MGFVIGLLGLAMLIAVFKGLLEGTKILGCLQSLFVVGVIVTLIVVWIKFDWNTTVVAFFLIAVPYAICSCIWDLIPNEPEKKIEVEVELKGEK